MNTYSAFFVYLHEYCFYRTSYISRQAVSKHSKQLNKREKFCQR